MGHTIPKGWEEKTLGEVCELFTGNSINEKVKKDKYTNLKDGYNYIATKDIDYNSKINYENGIKIPYNNCGFKIAPKNTILLCIEGGSAGRKIGIISQPVCFVNKLCAFKNKTDCLSINFLYYYLQSSKFKQIFYDKKTGLIGGVSIGKLKTVEIYFPSIEEQKLIVAKLDKTFETIDKLKANAEKNLKNVKELFESTLNKLFTENTSNWEEKTLGSISDLKQNKAEVKNIDANTLVSFVPMEYLGINQKYFNSDQSKPIKSLIKSYTYFAENDVIMAKITPCFENGKIGIASGLMNKIGFGSSEYIVFRPNKDINSEYLYYFLNREAFRKEGAQNMLGAVGHKRVSKEFIENYLFSYPSLSDQQKIVNKLDKLQEKTKQLENFYTQKIQLLDELKQSILNKAFKGEL